MQAPQKELLLYMQELRQGQHILTSKEFKTVAFLCCFQLDSALFSESNPYLLSQAVL